MFQNIVCAILFEAAGCPDRYATNFKKIGWKLRQCGPKNDFEGAWPKNAESSFFKIWKSCNSFIKRAIKMILVSIYMFISLINPMAVSKLQIQCSSPASQKIYSSEKRRNNWPHRGLGWTLGLTKMNCCRVWAVAFPPKSHILWRHYRKLLLRQCTGRCTWHYHTKRVPNIFLGLHFLFYFFEFD